MNLFVMDMVNVKKGINVNVIKDIMELHVKNKIHG